MKKKRPHYYYKIGVETATGLRLQDFFARCARAQEQARKWAMAQGASHYYELPDGMAGGVGAVVFGGGADVKGWERIEAPGGEAFYLPERGGELEREMYSLPVVFETELVAVLSLKPSVSKSGKPMPFTFGDETPVVFLHRGFYYADMPYLSEAADCAPVGEKEFRGSRLAAINLNASGDYE